MAEKFTKISYVKTKNNSLTRAEEIDLAEQIEVGLYASYLLNSSGHPSTSIAELRYLVRTGRAAKKRLYLANLGIVGQLATSWGNRLGLPISELFQEGCVGLGEAINAWDCKRGTKFSTFAWKYVLGAVSRAGALRCGQLEGSVSRAKSEHAIRRDWQKLESLAGRRINVDEFSEISGHSKPKLRLVDSGSRPISLTEALADKLVADSQGTEESLPEGWGQILNRRELYLVEARYGFDGKRLTCNQIGQQLNVSASTVRRLEKRAINKLRTHLKEAA